MPITTPLPSPPSIADPTNFATKADAFVAAMVLFQTELNAYAASLAPLGRNMLINGLFQVHQQTTVATPDDSYCFDRWYALTQTAAVDCITLTEPENGYTHALRLSQSQATAQRFGIAQIVEGLNCKYARGGSVTLSGRARMSVSTTLRYAIIGWTGTEDVVISDWVNSWTNGTFTAGNFFISTTISILGTGSIALTANTWTQITALTASAGTTFKNLSVMFWTDTAQAQNVTLDIDYAQLELGATANPVERRTFAQELMNCQRYFNALTFFSGSRMTVGQCSSTTAVDGARLSFPPMRTTPSVVSSPTGGVGANQAVFMKSDVTGPVSTGTLGFSTTENTAVVVSANGATASSYVAGNATLLYSASGCLIWVSAEL